MKQNVPSLLAFRRSAELAKHPYVRLIEYSLAKPRFAPNDACLACSLEARDFKFVASSIYILNAQQDRDMNLSMVQDWVLTPQAYFSYLQYLEFLHAIKTARSALLWAVAAVVVSLIGVAVALK